MTTGLVMAQPREEDRDLIDRVIGEQAGRPGALLGILEKLQEHNRHKYLPMETLEYVAERTGVPQSQVYGVATFYALSTSSRRARTPWPSVAAPHAIPAARGRCSSA